MRIGLDGRFWSKEAAGLARYSRELVKNLLTIDRKNHYFLFLLADDYQNLDFNAKNLTPIKIDSPHYSAAEQFKFPFELTRTRCDFIHFLSFNHPIFWSGKFIITVHDLTLYFYPDFSKKTIFHYQAMRLVMSNAIKRAVKIICPSESTKQDIIRKFKNQKSKIKVTYEGVPAEFKPMTAAKIERFKKQKGLTKPFILYLGQWRAHKNLIRLVSAFEMARKKFNFQLVLGGKADSSYSELMTKINQSSAKSDIICPGFIPESDLPLWYSAATAFVFPSLYEGFGLPPLEALSCGTPVAASDISSLPEILGPAAMYFDPKDLEQISDSLYHLVADQELRKEMTKKGLEQAKKFSFQKMANQTLAVYNSVK